MGAPLVSVQVVDDANCAYAERQAALYEEWREQVFEKIQVSIHLVRYDTQ